MTTTRLTGHDAIHHATAYGLTLSTYTDPTAEGRAGVSVHEARGIACVDPSLVFLDVSTAERMADLIRGAEAGDPAVTEGLAAGDFACHWTDAEIAALAAEMGIAAPLDCDAIRALVEALDRREAELDAANREDA